MKNFFALAAAALAVLALAGCGEPAPQGPSFQERCDLNRGTVLEDSTTRQISGVVTGSVVTPSGGVAFGTGWGYGTATITVRQCVVNGAVTDMEVV